MEGGDHLAGKEDGPGNLRLSGGGREGVRQVRAKRSHVGARKSARTIASESNLHVREVSKRVPFF